MPDNISTKRKQKYTTEQLAEIERIFSSFNVKNLFDSKNTIIEEISKRFLGPDKLTI